MLDKQQVEFFHQNGYLMVDGLYNQQQIDQLEEAYDASIPGRMRDFTHGDWKKNEPEAAAVYRGYMTFNASILTGLTSC